ncbi:MAG: ABC transporter permease [Candidatus Cloacimonas sp.]|nr:ABC transporter permease [Candidatus Cloacimonadota bacterium]
MDLLLIKKYMCRRNSLLPKPSHTFSLLGIIIGVTALLIVSSVMNGFEQDMKSKIIGSKAEIRITNHNQKPIVDYQKVINTVQDNKYVKAAAPIIQIELLANKDNSVTALNVIGIDYQKYDQLINLDEKIRVGYPDQTKLDEDGIIVGLDLSLNLNATVGEFIQLTSPISDQPTPFGMLPKMKKMKVIGIYSSEIPGYDNTNAFISLDNGRLFAGINEGISSIQVSTFKPQNSRKHARLLKKELNDEYLVEDWSKFDANLFQAMRLEKNIMVIVLTLMLVISGFNMGGNSLKIVAEKKDEIGILKAIGMPTKQIENIFLHTNLLLGMVGVLFGLFITGTFLYLQHRFHLIKIPVPGFPMEWLPLHPKISDFVTVPIMVATISILATIVALHKIRNIEPIRIIRNIE